MLRFPRHGNPRFRQGTHPRPTTPLANRRTGVAVVGIAAALVAAGGLTGCSSEATDPPAPPDLELPVAFALERDQEGLAVTALARSTPSDAQHRQWLTAQQIADEYGAPQDVADSVLSRLQDAGFDGQIHPTRGLIVGAMSAQEAEEFLGVQMVTTNAGDLELARPATAPNVPGSLLGEVTDVIGLTMLYPAVPKPSPPAATPNQVTCAPAPEITAQIAEYYGLAPVIAAGRGGAGSVIGMLQTDQSSPRALQVFNECYDVRIAPVETVQVDASAPEAFGDSAQESTLDIIAASLIAPNLDGIKAYQFNPRTSLVFPLSAAIGDALAPDGPDIISTSIGVCENSVRQAALDSGEWLLASAAAAGITVVAASGDTGSSSCAPNDTSQAAQYPASSLFVTGVGGTQPIRQGNQIVAQQVWNTSPQTLNAGGGATTSRLPRPPYQSQLQLPGGRIVPDLAFVAAPATFGPIPVCDSNGQCTLQVLGGTSATAPGLAAAISEIMDALAPGTAEPEQLGLLNPAIYEAGNSEAGAKIFMDVTSGNNDLFDVGCCTAVPGYDAASGWGSVDFAELLAELDR